MNCLGCNIFSLELRSFDSLGNLVKVHRLLVVMEDYINLVANVLWIDHWPLYKAPALV